MTDTTIQIKESKPVQDQELTIYRDGELQQPAITERAWSHLQAFSRAFATKVGECATEFLTPVILDYEDARNGTHLRDEYFRRKREAAAQTIAQQFHLV